MYLCKEKYDKIIDAISREVWDIMEDDLWSSSGLCTLADVLSISKSVTYLHYSFPHVKMHNHRLLLQYPGMEQGSSMQQSKQNEAYVVRERETEMGNWVFYAWDFAPQIELKEDKNEKKTPCRGRQGTNLKSLLQTYYKLLQNETIALGISYLHRLLIKHLV